MTKLTFSCRESLKERVSWCLAPRAWSVKSLARWQRRQKKKKPKQTKTKSINTRVYNMAPKPRCTQKQCTPKTQDDVSMHFFLHLFLSLAKVSEFEMLTNWSRVRGKGKSGPFWSVNLFVHWTTQWKRAKNRGEGTLLHKRRQIIQWR